MDPVLSDASQKIDDAFRHLQHELAGIRAGRANPALIENIPVDVYGEQLKLMEVGTINAPQPSLLTVQVWDASIADEVVKAILEANLGLNPANDGGLIRLPIPPLTEERRQEFIKLAHQKGETVRVEIRQVRAEERDKWEKAKTAGEFGEDELARREKLLQNLVDKSSSKVEELVSQKTAELSQV